MVLISVEEGVHSFVEDIDSLIYILKNRKSGLSINSKQNLITNLSCQRRIDITPMVRRYVKLD